MLGPNQLPQVRDVNIHHVSSMCAGCCSAEYPNGPTIVRDYDPSIPDLHADADRLIQALLNIGRNGAQAAGRQGS
jgi:two-component system nitrogen regulation sensor histidine kinase GlnL